MTDVVRVGLVGASAGPGWSSIAHIPGLEAADGIELAAVCTSRPQSARAAADAYGVPGFHDIRELAAQEDIDLISVVVRVPSHRAAVMAAIEGGKHVFSEWPLGISVVQASEMAAAAAEAEVMTGVGLQGRQDPHLTHIRNSIADGFVGDVVAVHMTMFSGGGNRHAASEAWMGDRANGANFFTIVGGHVTDALEFCVGPLSGVRGSVATRFPTWELDDGSTIDVDAPDSLVLQATVGSGAPVSLHAATVPHHAGGWVMRIHGTDGTIVASTSGLPQITPIELLGARGSDPLEAQPLPAGLADGMPAGPAGNVGRAYADLGRAITEQRPFAPDFAHAEQLHALLGSVAGNRTT